MEQENTNNQGTQENQQLTMSQTEYDKAIQSAEDKLRTNYSKQIKALEDKVKELTPKEKTDAELDYENRVKALEAKENKIALLEKLNTKNIDSSIADYLKDDVDIDSFTTAIENLVNSRIEKTGYKPIGHTNSESISKEKWAKMNYSEKQEFYNSNPELAKKLMGM